MNSVEPDLVCGLAKTGNSSVVNFSDDTGCVHSIAAHIIPVSVIIVTKNEEENLPRCLRALGGFGQVIVVDSSSADQTADIAKKMGAECESFVWNGAYPKKRGWCLTHLNIKYDWVFFVDADEVVTPRLKYEIAAFVKAPDPDDIAGLFIDGRYVWGGRKLGFGACNSKVSLFHKDRMGFPVVDDLHIDGMGEIEGHYQPVLNPVFKEGQSARYKLAKLPGFVWHFIDDQKRWSRRHFSYASWEVQMNKDDLWPQDPSALRQMLKKIFRSAPFRGLIVFLHSYIYKLGFLDGLAGFDFAHKRGSYYRLIGVLAKDLNKRPE